MQPPITAGLWPIGETSRWCWSPRGVPLGARVAVASSRRGRSGGLSPAWLEYFRDACLRVRAESGILLAGQGTPAGRFARHASKVWGLPVAIVAGPAQRLTFDDWRKRLGDLPIRNASGVFDLYLSPPTHDPRTGDEPVEDRMLCDWSDRLFVIALRRGGHWERLLMDELARTNSLARVHFADSAELVPESLRKTLLAAGAVQWHRSADGMLDSPETRQFGEQGAPMADAEPSLRIAGGRPDEDFLSHCTHRPPGPWPGQSEEDYCCEVLRQPSLVRRTPLDSLIRILRSGRLLASSAAIRGRIPVVCFSAVPLWQLLELREFQSQRHCWSFEPYGLRILKTWLMERGTRPVVYGDDQVWRNLDESQRPFFQRASSTRKTARKDWTREKEWRYLGDLDLNALPSDAAEVFVADEWEASALRRWSRWPVRAVGRRNT